MKAFDTRALLVVVLLCAASGCTRANYAQAIEAVIAADKALADAVPSRPSAKDVRAYADAMGRIDLTRCPEDFQRAFLKHQYAWHNTADFVEEWGGFWGTTVQIVTEIFGDTSYRDEATRLRKSIEDTWLEVEAIALRYGVPIHEYR